MPAKRRIVDAKSDSKGRTTHIRFNTNIGFISVEKAKPIVERAEVANAHVVKPKGHESYIRTKPDSKRGNNLDDMSGDK